MALYFTWRMTIDRSAIQIVPLPFSMLLVQRIFATWLPRRDGIGYEVEAMRSIRTELAVPSWTSTPPFVLVTSTRSLSISRKMNELAGVPLVGFGHERQSPPQWIRPSRPLARRLSPNRHIGQEVRYSSGIEQVSDNRCHVWNRPRCCHRGTRRQHPESKHAHETALQLTDRSM